MIGVIVEMNQVANCGKAAHLPETKRRGFEPHHLHIVIAMEENNLVM